MTLRLKSLKGQVCQGQIADAEPALSAALPLLKNGFSIYEASQELQCSRSTLREQHLAFQELDLP